MQPLKRSNIIVLGICGTISLDGKTFDPSSVEHLKALIEHDNCEVVVSSFGMFTEDEAKRLFFENHLPLWADHLAIDPEHSISQRIEKWLTDNGSNVKGFVVLDPENLGEDKANHPFANYQVMTNFKDGLNDDMSHLAKKLLDSSMARTFCR